MAEDMILTIMIASFGILFTVGPLLFSWLVGNWHQKRLVTELLAREMAMSRDPLTTLSTPVGDRSIVASDLVFANIVTAPSIWQLMLAGWKTLFGGRLNNIDKMVGWGRAEVMHRLREAAVASGWDDVINVRIETSTLTQASSSNKKRRASVELVAYGTGVRYD